MNTYIKKELQSEWNNIIKKHSKPLERGAVSKGIYVKDNGFKTSIQPYRRGMEYRNIPSLETKGNNVAPAAEHKVYTGDSVLGIGILHKSNMVPIFNSDAAKDIAKMRRG